MVYMKMDLFVFPVSLILLLSLLRIKKKTYHNSIFVISNNIIVGDSKATVAFLLFKILERKNFNKSKFFRNNTNVIKMTIRNIHLL